MVSLAVLVVPSEVALIVASVVKFTLCVLTVKLAVECPAATMTLEGTEAEELLLDRVTGIPPVGAGPLRVTVPVDELSPVTVVGLRETETKVTAAAGLMVSEAV
jgi:hypothetical protein